jgi:hypothetical protein
MIVGSALGDAAALLGAATALLALWAAARTFYRRTLGRRRDRYERLSRLGTGARLAFFVAVLGEPPAISRTQPRTVPVYDEERGKSVVTRVSYVESFFVDRDYYVQTISDEDGSVVAFSVTSRRRRFRPTFTGIPVPSRRERRRWELEVGEPYRPLFKVTLGRTRFHELSTEDAPPPQIQAEVGARSYSYTEGYYYGNPGYHQSFFMSTTSAARFANVGDLTDLHRGLLSVRPGVLGWPDREAYDEGAPEAKEVPTPVERFRRATTVTTYTVLGPQVDPTHYDFTFGPHGDEVRTLP